jgi:hypothetical protein
MDFARAGALQFLGCGADGFARCEKVVHKSNALSVYCACELKFNFTFQSCRAG